MAEIHAILLFTPLFMSACVCVFVLERKKTSFVLVNKQMDPIDRKSEKRKKGAQLAATRGGGGEHSQSSGPSLLRKRRAWPFRLVLQTRIDECLLLMNGGTARGVWRSWIKSINKAKI